MGKKENHKQDLIKFFDKFLESGDEGRIIEYLLSNSNLPGRRGNLELGGAFAEVVEAYFAKDPERLWSLCVKLVNISADEAPVNDPKEFLPFCGTWAIGAIGSSSSAFFQNAVSLLQRLANDPRWRTRESVANGIQKLIEKQKQKTFQELEGWIKNDSWLAMRAVAAGVAEPALLIDKQTSTQALELHKKIFAKIFASKERKSEEFKTLKKGLGYTLSVVVREIPEEGFEYLHQLTDSKDTDILWIIKENLKKKRLIKNFPKEVASATKLLNKR
ncbi:MAG: hypothetical protein ACFFCD_07540 [Promethearchaeota archaeon]